MEKKDKFEKKVKKAANFIPKFLDTHPKIARALENLKKREKA